MPTLIEMRLKAAWTVRPDTRKLHGLACALFEEDGTGHFGQDKPFAVWPLQPVRAGSAEEWEWRVAWLPDGLAPARALAASQLRIGHVTCSITQSAQRRVTRAQLAASPAVASVTVSFRSPTYFSQNGTDVVLPDPRLIAGSWRRRWNASLPDADPLTIGDDAWRMLHRSLYLAAFSLRTENRDSGHGREHPGFTGTATLSLDRNATARGGVLLAALAGFAEYSGTGAQTTHGFGATALSSESAGSRPAGQAAGVCAVAVASPSPEPEGSHG